MTFEPDLINGIFEWCGGLFIWLSVIKLRNEKVVRGVSWMHVAFFSGWGFWNLFYYPHLGQWLSFWGGCFLVGVNAVWLAQIAYYNHVNRRKQREFMHDICTSGRTLRYRHNDK